MLINAAHLPTVTQNDIIVTNVRHYEALSKALDAIHRVQDGLDSHISGDFLSQDIRECIFFISDIAGEVTNDMVLQNIFQHFCIGTFYIIVIILVALSSFFVSMIVANTEIFHSNLICKAVAICALIAISGTVMAIIVPKILDKWT